MKAFYCMAFAVGDIVATNKSKFSQAKYIAALAFGYVCFRVWKQEKPAKELAAFFVYIQPLLFGPVGAQLEFSKLNPSILGNCFALIIIALIARSIACFCVSYVRRDYTIKERIFIAICWSPKAAVQAVLGAMFLAEVTAKKLGD